MMIDCDSCTVRGAACTDCVVTFLTIEVRPSAGLDSPADARATAPGDPAATPAAHPAAGAPAHHAGTAAPASRPPVDLDDDERAAIDVLASSGLVPPLRMVRAV